MSYRVKRSDTELYEVVQSRKELDGGVQSVTES